MKFPTVNPAALNGVGAALFLVSGVWSLVNHIRTNQREEFENENQAESLRKLAEALTNRIKQLETRLQPGHNLQQRPTRQDYEKARQKFNYVEEKVHIAVTGISGTGKSSFINSIRGLANSSNNANLAEVGITECTKSTGRYPDLYYPIVWFDIPGAGTLSCPKETYFISQGLFVFDCIILVTDSRFTETDIAILDSCRGWNIPTIIVRSKSDIHIKSLITDRGLRKSKAKEEYTKSTEESIAHNLNEAGLPSQRVFLISKESLLETVTLVHKGDIWNLKPSLDEVNLLEEILHCFVKVNAPALLSQNGRRSGKGKSKRSYILVVFIALMVTSAHWLKYLPRMPEPRLWKDFSKLHLQRLGLIFIVLIVCAYSLLNKPREPPRDHNPRKPPRDHNPRER